MKVPMPWQKGPVNQMRRYLFKRTLRRRLQKMARLDKEMALEVGLGLLAVGMAVGAGAWIFGKASERTSNRRTGEQEMLSAASP